MQFLGSVWLFGLDFTMFWSSGILMEWFFTNQWPNGYQPKAPTSANSSCVQVDFENQHVHIEWGLEVKYTLHIMLYVIACMYVLYIIICIHNIMYLIIHYMIHAYSTCTLFSWVMFPILHHRRPQERSQPHGCGQSRHSGGMSLHPDLHVASAVDGVSFSRLAAVDLPRFFLKRSSGTMVKIIKLLID